MKHYAEFVRPISYDNCTVSGLELTDDKMKIEKDFLKLTSSNNDTVLVPYHNVKYIRQGK